MYHQATIEVTTGSMFSALLYQGSVLVSMLYRIVCDGWLEVCLKLSSDEAEELLSSVVKLRDTWRHLVELKLEGVSYHLYFVLFVTV